MEFANWQGCDLPTRQKLTGQVATLRPYESADKGALYAAIDGVDNHDLWAYLKFGPYKNAHQMDDAFSLFIKDRGFDSYVICDKVTDEIYGIFSLLNIRQADAALELGAVIYGKKLQRSRQGTEAFYLITDHVFQHGYRRYEWKANNNNLASKKAAMRYGFQFEGVFRQDAISKGENRDTAWFSMLDSEWPILKPQFEAWLADENFDIHGLQKSKLIVTL